MSTYSNPFNKDPYGQNGYKKDKNNSSNIEPIFQQLLGHLAKAHSIASNNFTENSIGRHLKHIENAQANIHRAIQNHSEFLTESAKAAVSDAIDAVAPVSMSAYNDTIPTDPKEPQIVNHDSPAGKFHSHVNAFVRKAHTFIGGSIPGEEE